METRTSYDQRISNAGAQEVPSGKKRQRKNKSRAVRGRDLRSGK